MPILRGGNRYRTRWQSSKELEAMWTRALRAMSGLDLGLAGNQKFFAYIDKMERGRAEQVRKSITYRPKGPLQEDSTDLAWRAPCNWEEAHEVMLGQGEFDSGTRAMSDTAGSNQPNTKTCVVRVVLSQIRFRHKQLHLRCLCCRSYS